MLTSSSHRPGTDDAPCVTNLAGDGAIRNGGVSHWLQQVGIPAQRPALPGDTQVDVAIVGAGMTGLWSAYYLKSAQPDLRIVVVEQRFAGFGASGRNGGWLSAEPAGLFRRYAADRSRDAAIALQREMFRTVDETLAALDREGIKADVRKDGLMYVATNRAQEARLRDRFEGLQQQGWGAEDLEWLERDELVSRVNVANALGGYRTPHCARVDPAKLTLGLARAVERLGVTIYEGTTATAIEPRRVLTDRGTIRADVVVRALEGFTGSLRGERRRLLPMNSSIVVTEPLPQDVWEAIRWDSAALLGDGGNSYAYLQHTADGRIAIGGRGVPYNFASRFDPAGRTADKAIGLLHRHLKGAQVDGCQPRVRTHRRFTATRLQQTARELRARGAR